MPPRMPIRHGGVLNCLVVFLFDEVGKTASGGSEITATRELEMWVNIQRADTMSINDGGRTFDKETVYAVFRSDAIPAVKGANRCMVNGDEYLLETQPAQLESWPIINRRTAWVELVRSR